MSLRYPVNIRRRAPGAHIDGRWVPGGTAAPEPIMATVQPATAGDYDQMQPLLEGRRVEGMIRVYTTSALTVAGEDPTATGDLVAWPDGLRDRDYVVIARSAWQSRIIPHFRYLAALLIAPR